MFCPNCGTQNPDTAQTCSKCSFNLKGAAAPKFKGTMLMNQPPSPRSPTPVPPPPGAAVKPAAATTAFGASPPSAAQAPSSKLKGTMVGVAPPGAPPPFGQPPKPPAGPAGGYQPPPGPAGGYQPPDAQPAYPPPPAYGAPAMQQSYGSAAVNPMGSTVAESSPFGAQQGFGPPQPQQGGFGSPPPPAYGQPPGQPYGAPPQGGFGGPPPQQQGGFGAPPPQQQGGFGAPPPQQGGFGAPPPQQGGFGAPPPQQGGFGAPPPQQGGFGAPPPQQGGFGAPPPQQQGGFGAPPPDAGGFGAPPPQQQGGFGGPPPGGYGAPPPGGYGAPPPGQDPYGAGGGYAQQNMGTPGAMQPMGGFGQGGPMQPYGQASAAAPGTWDIGGVLGAGWDAFKKNWVVLVFAPFVGMVAAYLPMFLMLVIGNAIGGIVASLFSLIGFVAFMVLFSFVLVGMVKIFLKGARGETPSFGDVFSGASRFVPMLGAMVIVGCLVSIGYVFLVVPGVILALGLSLTTFYVVDQNMGPIEAAKASWAATSGQKLQLFLFGLVAFLCILAGELACGVGVLVAMPVVYLAHATIYLRLSGRTAAAAPGAPAALPQQ